MTDTNVTELVQPKKYVRVVTTQGFFDLDMLDGFNMANFVLGIKGAGHLLGPMLYQPESSIVSIFVWSSDKPPKDFTGDVVPFPKGSA